MCKSYEILYVLYKYMGKEFTLINMNNIFSYIYDIIPRKKQKKRRKKRKIK
jgi:hypothetical protein